MADERLVPNTSEYIEILFHWHRYYMATNLATGKRVIDLASGEGYGTHLLASAAADVLGIDVSPDAVQAAREKYQRDNLRYTQGNAIQIPADDASCELFTSFETIEHMPGEDQIRFVKEIKRVLQPGGLALVSTPNKLRTEAFPVQNPFHIKEFYPDEFLALLKEHFDHVALYYQEVNLASVIWHPEQGKRAQDTLDFRVKHGAQGYVPAAEPLQPFFYVIAVCSDLPLPAGMHASFCHEVNRKPLETIWNQVGALEYQNELRQAEVERLKDEVASLQESNDYLKQHNRLMAKSIDAYCRKAVEAETVLDDYQRIKYSASYKIIRGYQVVMDKSPFGALLRPIRDLLKGATKA